MSKKPRHIYWDVAGFGKRGRFFARYAAGAVAQFTRPWQRHLDENKQAIRTDRETGGWSLHGPSTYRQGGLWSADAVVAAQPDSGHAATAEAEVIGYDTAGEAAARAICEAWCEAKKRENDG